MRMIRMLVVLLRPEGSVPRTLWRSLLGIRWLSLMGLAAVLPAASQDAAAPAYHIELVIFRANAAQGGAENWSIEAGTANTIGEESASGPAQVGRFVGLIPAAEFQLTDLENKLRASGAYVPVAHVAWAQTASAWGTRAGFPIQKLGVDVQGLTGNIALERGQYLHLGVSLNYAMPTPPRAWPPGPAPPSRCPRTGGSAFTSAIIMTIPLSG